MTQLFQLSRPATLIALLLISSQAAAQQGIDLARAAATELAKELGDQELASFEEAARSYFDWGAIIRPDGKVLSVRAGSVAASMGLQINDQVIAINDRELTGDSLAEVLTYLAGLDHASQITATIERAGQSQQLSGQVLATVVPGWRLQIELPRRDSIAGITPNTDDCGRLSVFLQPNLNDHYPVRIHSINGELYKSLNPNLVLPVGEHIIGVIELINHAGLKRSSSVAREKLLSVVIEANKKYHLGAHFIDSQRYERVNQNYWEPVVWKVTEQSCVVD